MKKKLLPNQFSSWGLLKENLKFLLIIVALIFGTVSSTYAKDKGLSSKVQNVIQGQVVSENGETLPGVSVIVTGSTLGTTTDVNGNYSISVPNTTGSVEFSFIGFVSQTVAINGRTQINVTLVEDNQALDEVVVIGYQTIRKEDLTGSVGIINTANTERTVSRSLPESLQGLSSGVTVRNGGAPGQEAVVNIRGLNTFYGNASPLYIIDGMYADPNTTINPNDVETIQVLKDASAAAIYGSRAANGVIIVTTKKGRAGEPRVEASARYSVSTIPRTYEMMNASEYVTTNTNAYNASGLPIQPSVANYNGQANTNWSDELLRTGSVQDFNANISGGTENSSYLVSAGYFKDKGTLIAREFERTSLRVNTETSKGRFTIGENLSITNSKSEGPFQGGNFAGNPWYDMFSSVPILPVRSDELISAGNPGGWAYGSNETVNTFARNQLALIDITSINSNFVKLLGNAYLDFDILDNLTYRFNAGLETSFDKSKSVRRAGSWYQNQAPAPTNVIDNRSQFLSYLFEHTLNFNQDFDKHRFNGVVGYTQQTVQSDNSSGGRNDLALFGGQYFTTINSATGEMTSSGGLTRHYIDSFLGRLNYTYDDKYLATVTFRSDKDSRFSPGFRTGNFPSVALAWRLSNEEFFGSETFSDFKIRASYGLLGNANLSPYQYTGFLNQGPNAVFGPGQQTFTGATQARLVSEELRWEEKETTNVGIDATFFDSRFTVTIDAFRSVSSDVLVPQPLPWYLGNLQGDPLVNIGSIENKGIEFDLVYRAPSSGDFSWNLGVNMSMIRNKVLELGNLGIDEETGLPRAYITSGNTRSQVGRAIGEYYVLKTDGIFQNEEEVTEHFAQSLHGRPGDIRYKNLVDDGTNDDINERDREFAGSPWPKLTAGLQFNSSYKNFTLSMQLYGAFGQKVYNDVIRELDSYGLSNYRRDINPWTPTNTNTDDPRIGVSYAFEGESDAGSISNARGNTDRWIEDGSFLRLRNLELGYSLPGTVFGDSGINTVRLFVSAQNLFTITKYRGLDPDVVGANFNLEPGVDNGNYPSSRIISFGLSLGL